MKSKLTIPIYNEQESFGASKHKGFYIANYVDIDNESLNRIDSHRHTYYEVIFVKKGKGVHTIDFADYAFEGPCLFLLHPKVVHKVHKEYATRGGVIKFTKEYLGIDKTGIEILDFQSVFDDIDKLPVINLTETEAKEISEVFTSLHSEYQKNTALAGAAILLYLKIYLLKIFEIKKKNIGSETLTSSAYQKFKIFTHKLETDFALHHAVAYYATALNISNRTLSNLCMKIAGKTAVQLINERILLEAKRLLKFSNLSAKEIAYKLGFDDETYFIRFFSKNIGMSPIKFRKNNSLS